jgi:hypothetical protein
MGIKKRLKKFISQELSNKPLRKYALKIIVLIKYK